MIAIIFMRQLSLQTYRYIVIWKVQCYIMNISVHHRTINDIFFVNDTNNVIWVSLFCSCIFIMFHYKYKNGHSFKGFLDSCCLVFNVSTMFAMIPFSRVPIAHYRPSLTASFKACAVICKRFWAIHLFSWTLVKLLAATTTSSTVIILLTA